MSDLPYSDLCIAECSHLATGRLIGQMFADQGAQVYAARDQGSDPLDAYFNRGKTLVGEKGLADTSFADVIIVDGKDPVERLPGQIVVHIVAALPSDETYGYLPDDCSDDLINGVVGFYTDMGVVAKLIGRAVIYTPLSLCTTYSAVIGANHIAAALFDARRAEGAGRTIYVSRIAGGLAAVGALALKTKGLPEHLRVYEAHVPQDEDTRRDLKELMHEAESNPAKELMLTQTAIAMGSPYEASDGRFVMSVGAPNWRLAERLLTGLGIYDQAMALGLAAMSPYLPEVMEVQTRNIADGMNMKMTLGYKLSRLMADAFKQKTAAEWERTLCVEHKAPASMVMSWAEWQEDKAAHEAGIFSRPQGGGEPQIGRVGWIRSVQPYPPLQPARTGSAPQQAARDLAGAAASATHNRPLEGVRVADFCNVIAGPNCGRMLAELGAHVIKIDPAVPLHDPTVMIVWAGESGAAKDSIIIDMKTDEGRTIMNQIVADCDMVVANKLDDQWDRMGLSREELDRLNPGIIQVALTAHRGDIPDAMRHNYPGYDPVIQGTTGIMHRFGQEGCPTLHGVASCVDYLCGYTGVWAAMTALYAQQRRGDGTGDWAECSLSVAATLNQFDLQYSDPPASAIGQYATGRNAGARVYKLGDGWIFAQAETDLTDRLEGLTRDEALTTLAQDGILASPVQSCADLAARHRDKPTPTISFIQRENDGWQQNVFDASWFANENGPLGSPGSAHRVGSDGQTILRTLGYTQEQIEALIDQGILIKTEWQNIEPALKRAGRDARV